MQRVPRTVVVLGFVSLFTDISSEMIYPLLPIFLSSILGATAIELGTIEGLAESTSAFLKIISGIWTDRAKRRKPFIVGGYGIAGIARPLVGFARSWHTVLALRFTDRVGKGIRSSPRDALIADSTPPEFRGTAYGFHRSMDHAGAVIGPLIGAILLREAGMELRKIFFLAAIPALIALLLAIFGVKEKGLTEANPSAPKLHLIRDWGSLGPDFHKIIIALFIFTLGNSTDAFLIIRLSQLGVEAGWIAGLWSLHHVVKMSLSYYCGRLSDSVSRKTLMLMGWFYYAAVYAAFAAAGSRDEVIAIFLLYGFFYGLTEPVERAWISDLAPSALRGTAFGYYHSVIGIGALPASIFFGLIWEKYGTSAAFYFGAALAALASVLLFFVPEKRVNARL